MRDFLAPETARRLTIEGHGTYSVPAPTTRQALVVLHMYAEYEPEEIPEAEEATLRQTCAEWLPLTVFSVIFSGGYPAEERREMLQAWLWTGIPSEVQERFKEQAEAAEEKPEEGPEGAESGGDGGMGWRNRIARYCHRMNTTWREALQVPFPSMVGQLSQVEMLRAQAVKDAADAQIIVRSKEGSDAYEQIAEQARGGGAEPAAETPDSGAWSDDPEERKKWKARKMAELHRVKGHMKHRSGEDVPEK